MAGDLERQIDRHRDEGWVNLDPPLRAFAIEYMNHLDHRKTAEALEWNPDRGKRMMRSPLVRAMIADLMKEQDEINIQTRHFVRERLMDLLPKLMGEEEVPLVTGAGLAFEARKFFPGEARATLEAMAKLGGFDKPVVDAGNAEIVLNFGDVMSPVQVNVTKE